MNASSLASLQEYLTEFKEVVTEELNNQSDMITDITNNIQVPYRTVPMLTNPTYVLNSQFGQF